MDTTNRFKQAAAEAAVAQLKDGMIVGLGSGSTATLAVAAIGERLKQGLRIIGIPTSEKTAEQARHLKIPLTTLGENSAIDITIDGADEVELGTLNLIKGGGGNQLREKIVAVASARLVIVVDESKVVQQLGSRFPIPVEVVRFGWEATAKRLRELNASPKLRLHGDGHTFVTDGGNYILDCSYGLIDSPRSLQTELDSIVGVVEHGLFIGLAEEAVVGGSNGITVLQRTS